MAKQEKRNGHAFHPIMRKGGAHEKTEKAKRKAGKRDLSRKVEEWLGRSSVLAIKFRSLAGAQSNCI